MNDPVAAGIDIKAREGIRDLLRAFQSTSRFRLAALPKEVEAERPMILMRLSHKGDEGCFGRGDDGCDVWLYKGKHTLYLWRSNGSYAPLKVTSKARFMRAFHDAILKATHHQSGYDAINWYRQMIP